MDASIHKEVSFEELCFDISPSDKDKARGGGIIWSSRLKESTGHEWTLINGCGKRELNKNNRWIGKVLTMLSAVQLGPLFYLHYLPPAPW